MKIEILRNIVLIVVALIIIALTILSTIQAHGATPTPVRPIYSLTGTSVSSTAGISELTDGTLFWSIYSS
jgi:hypothetical protein